MIILDFCSGNTCKNNWEYAKKMIDEMNQVVEENNFDKNEIIIKWQLFLVAGENISLDRKIFKQAYYYAEQLGYKTTASVFDKSSLDYLLKFDMPFVKIACVPETRRLIDEIPRKKLVIASYDKNEIYNPKENMNMIKMFCVRKYPADYKDYKEVLKEGQSILAVSDHTIGIELFRKYYLNKKIIWEKHFKLEDSTGLDSGPFAITPKELKEMLLIAKTIC